MFNNTIENQILVSGGWNGKSTVRTTEKYEEHDKVWTTKNNMFNHKRSGHALCRVGKGFFICCMASYFEVM